MSFQPDEENWQGGPLGQSPAIGSENLQYSNSCLHLESKSLRHLHIGVHEGQSSSPSPRLTSLMQISFFVSHSAPSAPV